MNSLKNLLSVLVVLSLLIGCSSQEQTNEVVESRVIDQTAISRLDSLLINYVDVGNVAGISALIIEKGEEAYFKAYGYADMEEEQPMERSTLVTIYSMTKPITGVSLMQLHEQGLFELDDPLSKYAPEFEGIQVAVGEDDNGELILEDPIRPMTIRDLTRHTGGLGNPKNLESLDQIFSANDPMNFDNTLSEMAARFAQTPLGYHPGERWMYGPSVDMQAFLVEKISATPYQEYVRNNVLDPLGLTTMRYFVPEEDRANMAEIYRKEGDSLTRLPEGVHALNYNQVALTPGGWGLTATIDDYSTFAQMLLNKGTFNGVQILKPETVDLMATNQLADSVTERMWLPSKGRVGFGIDFAVRVEEAQGPDEKVGAVGEFFWDGAASTLFWVDPENELTAVLFVQIFPFDNRLHKDIRDAVYGKWSN
ncbi:MAG: beta-lactamase family protein [Cyclobacteriaceae bacterium]